MARIHGKNTFVSIDGNDLSEYINNSEIEGSADTSDTTGYGVNSKTYIGGLLDGTFSCEGTYDDTASTGPRAVLVPIRDNADAVTIIRRPEGTGSGLEQDSFSAICTKYVETSPVAEVVAWSAEFQISGDVDRTAQA